MISEHPAAPAEPTAPLFPPALVRVLRERFASDADPSTEVADEIIVQLLTTVFFAGLERTKASAIRSAWRSSEGVRPISSSRKDGVWRRVSLSVEGPAVRLASSLRGPRAREARRCRSRPPDLFGGPRPRGRQPGNHGAGSRRRERRLGRLRQDHRVEPRLPLHPPRPGSGARVRARHGPHGRRGTGVFRRSDSPRARDDGGGRRSGRRRGLRLPGCRPLDRARDGGARSGRHRDHQPRGAAPSRGVGDVQDDARLVVGRAPSAGRAYQMDVAAQPTAGRAIRLSVTSSATPCSRKSSASSKSSGRYSAIDGAILLNRDLALIAFGVILPVGRPTAVAQAVDAEGQHGRIIDLGSRGTRHRAGVTYAARHPGSVVFVASEDGQVSCLLRSSPQHQVRLWRLGPTDVHISDSEGRQKRGG